MIRGSAILFAVCLLAACRAPKPADRVITPTVPDSWFSAHSPTNRPTGPWWAQFNNPTIDRLALEALTNNPDLKITANRLEQAQIRAQMHHFSSRPKLEISMRGGKQKNSFIGMPFGGGGVMQSQSESYGLNLAANWELDVWGRISAGKLVVRMETVALELDHQAARQSLVAQVIKSWVQLTEAAAQIALAGENVGILDLTFKQATLRHRLGTVSALDVRLAEANFTTAKAVLEEWRTRHAALQKSLELLLGRYPSGLLVSVPVLPGTFPPVPADVPSGILKRRPDIAATLARIKAADARVAEGEAGLLPFISLTGSTGTSSDELKDLVNSNFSIWSFGGNIAQTILLRDEQKTRVNERKSMVNEAILMHRRVVMNAFQEVESALSNDRLLGEQHRHLGAASDLSAKALDLAEDRYARGVEPFVTLLEAQRRYAEAKSRSLSVHRLRLENRVNLHLALGGSGIPREGSP